MNKIFVLLIIVLLNFRIVLFEKQFADIILLSKSSMIQNKFYYLHFTNQERKVNAMSMINSLHLYINYITHYIKHKLVSRKYQSICSDVTLIVLSDPPFY